MDETTNQKDTPGLTPERKAGTTEVVPNALGTRRKLPFKDGKSVFVICILIENKYNKILHRDKRAITRGLNYRYPITSFLLLDSRLYNYAIRTAAKRC